MIRQATGEINLGVTFTVTISGLDEFSRIASALRKLKLECTKAGLSLSGDWQKAQQCFATMPRRMQQSLSNACGAVAAMYEADVHGAWNTQSLNPTWQPLTPEYLAKKIREGLDSRTLIATGKALESLGYKRLGATSIEVGVTAQSEEGEPYMLVQEFGSSDGRVPARPLFKPVLDANTTRYIRVIVEAVNTALKGGVYKVVSV
jgi:hypothetical protein